MGHKPINKKVKHSRGLWSPDEDRKLREYILSNGHACWSSIPAKAGLQRNGKSCRLRWINYLRPGLKRGTFTLEEKEIVLTLHRMLGNKWAEISKHLPGRTDNEIKNYWHSNLKSRNHVKVEINSSMSCISLQSLDTMNSGSSSMSTATFYQPDSTVNNFATSGSFKPKLLFAEWFSQEYQQQQDNPIYLSTGKYDDHQMPIDSLTHMPGFQVDDLLQDLSLFQDFNLTPAGQEFGSGYETETYNPEGTGSFFTDIGIY